MTFCKYLTNTYHFTYDVVKPCCWIKDTSASIKDHDGINAKFKQLNAISDWIPECSYCHDLEKAGTESPRTITLKEPIFVEPHNVGDSIKVELQLDDDCNAACIMCSGFNSTTWQKYTEKTIGKTVKIHHKTTVQDRISSVESTINFDTVRQIHFFGGEPFNTDTQLRIIRQVKHPENTNLVYITNGSVFPDDETFELWSHFKNVNVAISLDGVGDQFNYIRWPLRWDQVESNIARYRDLNRDNIVVNTSFTGSPLNLFYVDRYTEWSTEFFKDTKINGRRWFTNPHPVVGIMNMSTVPPALREIIAEKYGHNSRIAKIITEYDPVATQKMIEYLDYHDGHRRLSWRKTFPEIAEYYE